MDSIDGWSNPPLENMDSHYLLPQVEDQATNGILMQSLPQDSVTFAIEEPDDEMEQDVEDTTTTTITTTVRKDNKPVIIEPHTLTSSHNQVTIKAEKKKRSPAKKKKKDPNAPGSVISAYTFFFRDKQATIKEQNPKAKFGDISKIVSQLWEALGETERAVYKQKNAEDKLRYGKELEAYKAGLDIIKDVDEDEDIQDEATKEVFSSTETTTDVNSHATRIIFPEEKTENDCIRTGCRHVAIKSPEWDDEYCSNECAVGHCKDVFAAWQAEQRV